jgi:hypothetical protein
MIQDLNHVHLRWIEYHILFCLLLPALSPMF